MAASAAEDRPGPAPGRLAWHRLHRSTWIALLPLAVVLTILLVPGEIQSTSQGSYGLIVFLQHGWPWPYIEERIHRFPFPTEHSDLPPVPSWMIPWAWSYRGTVEPVLLKNLIWDVAIAVLLLVLFAVALECRRRRRRLSQWTLRELLFGLLLVACFFAWWQVNNHRRAEEERVLQDLRTEAAKSGGSIGRTFGEYVGPLWLRRLLGYGAADAFQAHSAIYYQKPAAAVTAADLEPLAPYLAGLKHFDTLSISTDASIEVSAFETIARIPRIKRLYFYSNKNSIRISDAELRPVSRITDLKRLEFNHCLEVRGSDLLQSLTNLERLDIYTTKIDDPGLGFLAGMRKLRRLGLHYVPCDDTAVENISRLQNLERLELTGTEISKEGMDRLRAALPGCNTSLCIATAKKAAPGKGTPGQPGTP